MATKKQTTNTPDDGIVLWARSSTDIESIEEVESISGSLGSHVTATDVVNPYENVLPFEDETFDLGGAINDVLAVIPATKLYSFMSGYFTSTGGSGAGKIKFRFDFTEDERGVFSGDIGIKNSSNFASITEVTKNGSFYLNGMAATQVQILIDTQGTGETGKLYMNFKGASGAS